MKVSVVTDEVSSDFETALEVIKSWGMEAVELRGIGEQRFPQITDYWKYRLPQLLDEFGLKVIAISPGLFQTPPPGRPRRPMAFSRGGDMRIARDELETEARRDRDLSQLLPASIARSSWAPSPSSASASSAGTTIPKATRCRMRPCRSCAMPPRKWPQPASS
jgi:hypothetical protein